MKAAFFLFLSIILISALKAPIFAQNATDKGVLSQTAVKLSEDGLAVNRPRIIKSGDNRAEASESGGNSSAIFGLEKKVFDLINQRRAAQNLEPLEWSDDVAKIARMHSQNMADYKFFSHAGLDGTMVSDRADRLGISKWRAIGENIAYNRGFKLPLDCAVDGWMRSPMHRENLLDTRWKESAVGIAVAADGTFYFTQVFLARK